MSGKSKNIVVYSANSMKAPTALDEVSKEEFDAKMARGLAQAKAGEGMPANQFFEALRKEIQ